MTIELPQTLTLEERIFFFQYEYETLCGVFKKENVDAAMMLPDVKDMVTLEVLPQEAYGKGHIDTVSHYRSKLLGIETRYCAIRSNRNRKLVRYDYCKCKIYMQARMHPTVTVSRILLPYLLKVEYSWLVESYDVSAFAFLKENGNKELYVRVPELTDHLGLDWWSLYVPYEALKTGNPQIVVDRCTKYFDSFYGKQPEFTSYTEDILNSQTAKRLLADIAKVKENGVPQVTT
jgi:hypothetical protein